MMRTTHASAIAEGNEFIKDVSTLHREDEFVSSMVESKIKESAAVKDATNVGVPPTPGTEDSAASMGQIGQSAVMMGAPIMQFKEEPA